jgi:hypothetical protein
VATNHLVVVGTSLDLREARTSESTGDPYSWLPKGDGVQLRDKNNEVDHCTVDANSGSSGFIIFESLVEALKDKTWIIIQELFPNRAQLLLELSSCELSFVQALCDLGVRVPARPFLGLQALGAMKETNPSQGIGSVASANLGFVDDLRRWSDRSLGCLERLPEQPIYNLKDLSYLCGPSELPVFLACIGVMRRMTVPAGFAVAGTAGGGRPVGR